MWVDMFPSHGTDSGVVSRVQGFGSQTNLKNTLAHDNKNKLEL